MFQLAGMTFFFQKFKAFSVLSIDVQPKQIGPHFNVMRSTVQSISSISDRATSSLSSAVNFISPEMCSAMVPEIVFSSKVLQLNHQASNSQSI
jgi:hypothetical protein